MPFTFTMPKLSPTMDEGTIAKWHKKEGEFVEAGEVLLEIATDKATVEHSALDEGWLRKIIIGDGKGAAVNQVIAIFSEKKDDSIEGFIPKAVETPKKVAAEVVAEKPLEGYSFTPPTEALGGRIPASPLAKKIAQEKQLDITSVKGTGPHGRILAGDLERAQPAGIVNFGNREIPTSAPGTFEEEPLTPMRKMIAERLQEAKASIPHFYVRQEIRADAMVALREQLNSWNVHVTFNDFIVRASALALRKHPVVNSSYSNQAILHYKTIDIAIAVTVKGGLITPIVRHADYKNLGELSVEVRSLAKRAREMKLEPHEYKGGSFTISNLGMYGITDFQAIINPPQAAILAVGGLLDRPVIKNGQVVPGKVMVLTLSADHRVVDGVAAAEFLKTLQQYLENPAGLLI